MHEADHGKAKFNSDLKKPPKKPDLRNPWAQVGAADLGEAVGGLADSRGKRSVLKGAKRQQDRFRKAQNGGGFMP